MACGSHLSYQYHSRRGRRDMPLALSVWWCGPTGLAARAEHGNRWHRYISLQVVKVLRVCARVFARARFHGRVSRRSASNSTHNASPRPALPPRGLAWLPSCSLTCVHMLMAGLRNKSQESDHTERKTAEDSTSPRSHYHTVLDQTRRSGPRRGVHGRGPSPEKKLCCNSP